jgi:protein TonB
MTALTAEDFLDLRRWAICGAVVVGAHAVIVGPLVMRHEPVAPDEPVGAIVFEFAPELVTAPEQMQTEAVPEKPVEKVEEKPEEVIEEKGELQAKQKEELTPQQPREAVPVTTPPPLDQTKIAALPAGPDVGPIKPASKAAQVWMAQLSARLERNKRYPPTARARREQGIVTVFFSLDRQGRLLEKRIVKSSGNATLDAEALAMLDRAQPFGEWPRELSPTEHLDRNVPVRFVLK